MVKLSWLRDRTFWNVRNGAGKTGRGRGTAGLPASAQEETAPLVAPLAGPLAAGPPQRQATHMVPRVLQAFHHQVALSSLKPLSLPCGAWQNRAGKGAGLMFKK